MHDHLFDFLKQEQLRQKNGINLIASENYAPDDVRGMVGSELMNKYDWSQYLMASALIRRLEI